MFNHPGVLNVNARGLTGISSGISLTPAGPRAAQENNSDVFRAHDFNDLLITRSAMCHSARVQFKMMMT